MDLPSSPSVVLTREEERRKGWSGASTPRPVQMPSAGSTPPSGSSAPMSGGFVF